MIFLLLNFLYGILLVLIVGNVLIAYFPDWRYHTVGEFIYRLSEPILAPFRRLIPPLQTGSGYRLDISPAVCLIAARVVVELLLYCTAIRIHH